MACPLVLSPGGTFQPQALQEGSYNYFSSCPQQERLHTENYLEIKPITSFQKRRHPVELKRSKSSETVIAGDPLRYNANILPLLDDGDDADGALASLHGKINLLQPSSDEKDDVVNDDPAIISTLALALDDPYYTGSARIDRHADNSMASSYIDQASEGSSVSHSIHQREPVSGNSPSNLPVVELLQTLCKQGHLHRAVDIVHNTHTSLPPSIYISLLQACSRKRLLDQAECIHAHLAHYSPHNFDSVGAYLVVTLAKCGAAKDARMVSDRLPLRNVFSWTAIISANVDCGKPRQALDAYRAMKEDGIEPNVHTFSSLFKACAIITDKDLCRELHREASERGFSTDVYVGSTLVNMYSKCGLIAEAEDVFAMMSQCDTVVWNAMLSAYIGNGQEEKVVRLYRQMREERVSVDNHTLMFVLQACTNLANDMRSLSEQKSNKAISLEIGWAVAADALRDGLAFDDFVETALLTMLGKCGAIRAAQHLFSIASSHGMVLWTVMLSAYMEQGQVEMVLQMFKQLHTEGLSPDPQAFVVALKACALLAERIELKDPKTAKAVALHIGRALHVDAFRKGFMSNIYVGTALITMYGKCGATQEAEIVFGALPVCDDVSWTALLSVMIAHGEERKALDVYKKVRECTNLDDVALICILQACSERGSLEMCKSVHFDIISLGYDKISALAATLIHAYASCASIEDAQAVFEGLATPGLTPWNACIGAHTAEASINMFERMLLTGIEPNEATFTSTLSACSHGGLLGKGVECFRAMNEIYGVRPNVVHYSSLVGLFGRAGNFERVLELLQRMPMQVDLTLWLGLLRASQAHGNMEVALMAFNSALNLQHDHGAAYILMSNIYADTAPEDRAWHDSFQNG